MRKEFTYLEQLGFSVTEVKLYVTLLESGPMSVKELADAMKFNRTAMYSHINSLIEDGVILSILIGARKQLVALEPDRLKYLVDKKFEAAKTLQAQFPAFITALENAASRPPQNMRVDVKYFKGLHGINAMWDDMFQASELRIYAKLSVIAPLFPNEPDLFDKALRRNHDLRIYEIYGDSLTTIKHFNYKTKSTRYFYKFMPPAVGLTSPGIVIYDNKVAIVNVEDKVSGMILYNQDYYLNSKKLFDFIWQMLPAPSI